MRLVLDAEIVIGDRVFPIFLRYPDMFPSSPPSVFPRGDDTRWSAHQFGAGGELCLEIGPDNWAPDLTGVQMIQSAHRLLSQENPISGDPAIVSSRHQETLGQSLRNRRSRLIATRELFSFLATLPLGVPFIGNTVAAFHEKECIYVINKISQTAELNWTDPTVPKPFTDEGFERPVIILRIDDSATLPSTTDLATFKSACIALGFEPTENFVLLVQGDKVHLYFLSTDNQSCSELAVIQPQNDHQRVGEDHQILKLKSVALVGCGSLGSKVATILARCGVGRFFLVDDDLLLPDNFVRNDLDWRDVGSHKAKALSRRVMLANPTAETDIWRVRLGGQQSSEAAETLLKWIGGCDLIFDATANPDSLNILSNVVVTQKKALVWAEIFGGGIGGLIARYRPSIEPPPQYMRRAIENWFGEKGPPPVRSQRSYETGLDGPPLIADDADVTAIAAHGARLAVDVLIDRQPPLFPNSVYAIGLGVGSVFTQPFETFPIDVGSPPTEEVKPQLSPEETAEEVARIIKLFETRQNETNPATKDNPAS